MTYLSSRHFPSLAVARRRPAVVEIYDLGTDEDIAKRLGYGFALCLRADLGGAFRFRLSWYGATSRFPAMAERLAAVRGAVNGAELKLGGSDPRPRLASGQTVALSVYPVPCTACALPRLAVEWIDERPSLTNSFGGSRQMFSIETWAVVLATIVGPVAAVLITRSNDLRREQRNRLLHIYRVLMATRRMNISEDHVAAINLVEVEFHKVQPVIDAWSTYLTHLNATSPGPNSPVEQQKQWNDRRAELLAILISKIATHLGLSKGEIEILHGGYAPQAWVDRDNRMARMQDYVVRLADAQAVVPVTMTAAPSPSSPYPPPPAA
jgi:hypothetical protein